MKKRVAPRPLSVPRILTGKHLSRRRGEITQFKVVLRYKSESGNLAWKAGKLHPVFNTICVSEHLKTI